MRAPAGDPPRLVEGGRDVPDGLAGAIARARSFEPAAEDAARIRAALSIGAPPGGLAGTGGALAGAGVKWIVSIVSVAILGGAVATLVTRGERSPVRTRSLHDGDARPMTSAPELVPARPETAASPSSAMPAESPAKAVAPAGRPEPPRAPTPAPMTAFESTASPPPAPAIEEPTELDLLDRARSALPSAPARALEIVAEHERRFPSGALVQEREVIAIDALVRIGRRDEAVTRAERFRLRFPSSIHRRTVRELVEGGEDE